MGIKNIKIKNFLSKLNFLFITIFCLSMAGCQTEMNNLNRHKVLEGNYAIYLKDNKIFYTDLDTMEEEEVKFDKEFAIKKAEILEVKENIMKLEVNYKNTDGEEVSATYLKDLSNKKATKLTEKENGVYHKNEHGKPVVFVETETGAIYRLKSDKEKELIYENSNGKNIYYSENGNRILFMDKENNLQLFNTDKTTLFDEKVAEVYWSNSELTEFVYSKGTSSLSSSEKNLYKGNVGGTIENLGIFNRELNVYMDKKMARYFYIIDSEHKLSEFVEKDTNDKEDIWNKLNEANKHETINFKRIFYTYDDETTFLEGNHFLTNENHDLIMGDEYIDKIFAYNKNKFIKLKLSEYESFDEIKYAIHKKLLETADIFLPLRNSIFNAEGNYAKLDLSGDNLYFFKHIQNTRGDLYVIKIDEATLLEEKIGTNLSVEDEATVDEDIKVLHLKEKKKSEIYHKGEKIDEEDYIVFFDKVGDSIYYEKIKDQEVTLMLYKDDNIIEVAKNYTNKVLTEKGSLLYQKNYDGNLFDLYYFDGEKSHLLSENVQMNLFYKNKLFQ